MKRREKDPTEAAAVAARQAADEAKDPKVRRFLREHADHLARIAAARRAASGRSFGAVAPLIHVLPIG